MNVQVPARTGPSSATTIAGSAGTYQRPIAPALGLRSASARTVVDAVHRVVADPQMTLTADFAGVLQRQEEYRVIWRDKAGVPTNIKVVSPSTRFARLLAGAPATAFVQRA